MENIIQIPKDFAELDFFMIGDDGELVRSPVCSCDRVYYVLSGAYPLFEKGKVDPVVLEFFKRVIVAREIDWKMDGWMYRPVPKDWHFVILE